MIRERGERCRRIHRRGVEEPRKKKRPRVNSPTGDLDPLKGPDTDAPSDGPDADSCVLAPADEAGSIIRKRESTDRSVVRIDRDDQSTASDLTEEMGSKKEVSLGCS